MEAVVMYHVIITPTCIYISVQHSRSIKYVLSLLYTRVSQMNLYTGLTSLIKLNRYLHVYTAPFKYI